MWKFGNSRRLPLIGIALLLAVPFAASPATAADTPLGNLVEFFFGNNNAEAVANFDMVAEELVMPIDLDAGGQYLPLLFKAASRDLYFFKKVLQPNDEQYAELKVAAAKAARDLALEFAKAERASKSSDQWPRPRRFIADALLKRAAELLPADAVDRCREEVEAREAAMEAACQKMMVRALDNRLTLLPDQYEPMQQAVAKSWKQEQSANLLIYLYDEYLQIPEKRSLEEVLNDRQEKLLSSQNHGRIHFGWEQDLGLQGWNDNGEELPGLEDLSKVRFEQAEPATGEEEKPQAEPADAPLPALDAAPAAAVEVQR